MTKRKASKPTTVARLSADSLRHVMGGEDKPVYSVAVEWQPERIKFSKASG